MSDNIKSSFDSIRAEDKLKSETAQYLKEEIARRKEMRGHIKLRRYTTAFASALILLMSVISSYRLYFTPAAYVDLDVNPSVELILNTIDRVIDYHAYNDDGSEIIKNLPLKHKSYDDAIIILLEAMEEHGYLQNDGLVSVTLQTDNEDREKDLINSIQTGIEGYMSASHHTAQIDVFPVSRDTRSHSHEQGVSPAKYIAIQELIEVDPTASVSSCRNHSISEIKQFAREHGNHHNNMDADNISSPQTNGGALNSTDNPENNENAEPSENENLYHGHGRSKGGGRHNRGH